MHASVPINGVQSRAAVVIPISAAVVALANTLMTLVISFGLELSSAQQVSITATVNSFVVLIVSLSAVYRAHLADQERWSHLNGNE